MNGWIALSCLYRILTYNKSFIEELKVSNEIVYNKVSIALYQKGYLFIEYWNLFDYDINVAIKKFIENAQYNNYKIILDKYCMIVEKDVLISLIELMLKNVPQYDGFDIANTCLNTLIDILQKKREILQQEDMENVFQILNENRQIYDRFRGSRDNQISEIKKLGYELSKYKNLDI